ncbi:hypothetical protein EPI10_007109 [Gossypium australe]|uniref:DUF7745 domain-containing protein n=1 Tax=Gossypium australe TaxID=47621 RepID=A0A5B6WUQ6_9ROSI|nr:hypothetical protein EPI10_007109 [Gossypium australe]
MSKLWAFTRISVTQNNLQELKEIWDNGMTKPISYSTVNMVDLVPTVEEYTTLLCYPRIQVDKAYSRAVNVPAFIKRLMSITGMSEQWVSLRDLILPHLDTRKRVDVFTLSIYGLVIFPKALWHIDDAISDLFDRLDKKVMPIPPILAETFRSLITCRRAGEGRFIGCAQLLLAWFHSHFWKVKKAFYRVFSDDYSPLKEFVATPKRDNISYEKWMSILQSLQDKDVEWRAHWMILDEIFHRCGDFD